MSWLLTPLVVIAVIVAGMFAARFVIRRRRAKRASASASADVSIRSEPRVRQFLRTGSYRMPEPDTEPRALRHENRAQQEEEEVTADLATLHAFLEDVRDSVGADEAVFWRWSEERDALSPWAWSTPDAGRPQHFEMVAWGPLVQWAAEAKVMHFDADARVAVTRLAATPILHEERLLGVLSVARKEGLERGREHLKSWLPRHAAQVGRLVSLFELRREYGRHMRQSGALLAAAKRVQGHKSQEALSRAICETVVQVSSATEAALVRWRADVDRGWVQFATSGFAETAPFPLGVDSMASDTCTHGLMRVIEDVSKLGKNTSLFSESDGGWTKGTIVLVPLKLEERVIGAIVAASPEPGSIPRDEARNIALLGALAATSLEMVWEMEEVTRRARTDALTGLANRRAFDEQLEQLLAHADRFGHSVSLILADVDHFKQVNDTFGHEAGDAVLKAIATTLSDGIRAVDVCARFGGEEIAMLLPQTTLPGAVELADRLRKAVAAKPIHALGNEIPVTISCGVACYPEGVLTKEALFAAADRALYDAKSAGRNCVKSAVPKPIGVVR